MELKANIKNILPQNSNIAKIVRYLYYYLLKHDLIEHKKKMGERNKDKIIYIIRPNTEDGIQGLMSLFVQTMRKIDYALKNNYIPVVDFKNYKTQYYDGQNNAWEFFFLQPSNITLEEAYNSRNVILSGASLRKRENFSLFKSNIFNDEIISDYCYKLINNNIKLSQEVIDMVNKENTILHVENCIGVYIRGTDYTKLKPKGEYIQPEIDEMIPKIKEFLYKNDNLNIFLVTEDQENYNILKEEFKNKIKIVSFDSFIDKNKVDTFLSKTNLLENDIVKRGRNYLVKEILLSKCKYLISSITFGSIAAFAFNGNKYEDKYIFDKGVYK